MRALQTATIIVRNDVAAAIMSVGDLQDMRMTRVLNAMF
jgi:hypothetical protein